MLSVELGAMGAIYNARFPVKIHISGIFFFIDGNERSAPKEEPLYMTAELLQRSQPYFGSQMGAKEIHFLLN